MAGTYLLPIEEIQSSRLALAKCRIHPHFAGYLCVRHAAQREGHRADLRPNFRTFFDQFFSVAPKDDKPYVLPFSERGSDDREHYFNRNVAGSYAQSSLRGVAPLLKVVDVKGRANSTTYSLREDDAALAFEHLLLKQRISALDLAVFLYRNWRLQLDEPTPNALLDIFKNDFLFGSAGGETEFAKLFAEPPSRQIAYVPGQVTISGDLKEGASGGATA